MDSMVSVTLSFDADAGEWGAWVPDVSAYGTGKTIPEAMADLKQALSLYIEEVGKDSFLAEIAPPSQSVSIPLESLV